MTTTEPEKTIELTDGAHTHTSIGTSVGASSGTTVVGGTDGRDMATDFDEKKALDKELAPSYDEKDSEKDFEKERLETAHADPEKAIHAERQATRETTGTEGTRETLSSNDTNTSTERSTDDEEEDTASARQRLGLQSRGNTTVSNLARSVASLPPLTRRETKLAQKEAHPWQHLGITLGLPMIILFDIVIPCIIYYTWFNNQKSTWKQQCAEQYPGQECPLPLEEFNKDILGAAIASFGLGELWILLARVWRLYFRREECAPLLSNNKWELDATSWVYLVAMIVALIPFLLGSTLVIPKLYLYGPSCLMGFLGILMIITTLHPFNIPIGINSHARGSGLRPFIYYAAEDFIAVDGLQDREFRVRYNERYETNKMFRKFFLHLTIWWICGVFIYIGCVSAVIWTLPFHYAFGLSLGLLFSYIAIWAIVTFVWTKIEMRREHIAYENGTIE